MKYSFPEQIEPGSSISLPFDELEARDMSLGLPLTPRRGQPRANSGFISPKSSGKASEFRGLAFQGVFHPRLKQGGRVLSEQAEKGLGQVVERVEFAVRLTKGLELLTLFLGESVRRQAKPPGNLSWGCDSGFQRR